MYLFVRGIVTMPVTSQESHQSCICVVRGIVTKSCNKPGKSSVMYLFVRGIVTMPVTSQTSVCICVLEVSLSNKPGKSSVMYLFVRGIVTKSHQSCIVTSQESQSCICVLVISHVFVVRGIVTMPVTSQESHQSCICLLGASYRYQTCNKPGKSSVMYLFVRGIVTMPVTSQESHQSCICVLEVSLPCL